MGAELGETADPKELVPGNVEAVTRTLAALRRYGDALHWAGTGLRRVETTEGWSGEARDAFRASFDGQPGKWLHAGDHVHEAATALQSYSCTLTWAQGQAAEAIRQWQEGEVATDHEPSVSVRGGWPGAGWQGWRCRLRSL